MNVAAAVGGNPSEADFFDEQGLLKEYQPKVMNVLSGTSSDKPIMIEFGCGLTPLSIDRKLTLQVDTGADANAINKKTFDHLFPEVELEESTFILKNFDKRLIKPIGSFRCFLRWKGHKYRVQIEVMGTDTPNILSRETTFVMGILKKCFITEKMSIEQNTPNSFISGPAAEASTEGVFCHSVPPADAPAQVPSTEGVFGHSNPSTEAVFSHSVPPAREDSPNPSMETAQMHVASGQNIQNSPVSSNQGSNKQSLSITDFPLTQEKVESTYADVFQGLGKFPGEPYKLRLKPDAVPAKHRPRKVPVHLQEAFHEEVERLVKIDVLEPVTEPTEWVNSFVVVEKVIDSSNAHSPHHSIKKSIRLCIDPKDLNEALEREPYYSRSIDELISMFAGAKVFTIVDMDKGYWQVVLHPDSRKYTCMAFDIGRYQFKRLPMGSKVASDIFQRMLDSVYIGLPGVTGIADDMVIFGRNEEEHDRNLILFLETTRKNGLVLNKRKLQFKNLFVRRIHNSTSSAVIKELGMIFSEFGKPQIFRSDNGPCYSSQEFKIFMQNWSIEHRTSSPHYPQSNGLAESMVKVSKNLIEKAVLQDLPWNRFLLDYRCTPISSEIPSPAEILFGRKLRSSISILPSQVMNDRICKQRELIAKKEGKFYTNTKDFQDRIKAMPFEAGQNVWLQNSDSRKCEEAVIREKCREPNSYMVEIPATGQCFRRNSNFIKPRQSEQNPNSTTLQSNITVPVVPQEPPVFQRAVPSSPATSTVDAIPTVPSALQNRNSTPRQPRTSSRTTKGIPPSRLGLPATEN